MSNQAAKNLPETNRHTGTRLLRSKSHIPELRSSANSRMVSAGQSNISSQGDN